MIGIIAALAVAAVIVCTVMNRDAYRSMCFDDPESAVAAAPAAPADAAAGEPDMPQGADSLTVN